MSKILSFQQKKKKKKEKKSFFCFFCHFRFLCCQQLGPKFHTTHLHHLKLLFPIQINVAHRIFISFIFLLISVFKSPHLMLLHRPLPPFLVQVPKRPPPQMDFISDCIALIRIAKKCTSTSQHSTFT